MQSAVAWIESLLLNPFAALSLAFVFVVLGWKFDVSASSWFLVAAWLCATFSTYRTLHAHGNFPVVEHFLWTMLISAILGLLLVQLDRRSIRVSAQNDADSTTSVSTADQLVVASSSQSSAAQRPIATATISGSVPASQPQQAIAQRVERYGDLKVRTLSLAREIEMDLYTHGWFGPPRDYDGKPPLVIVPMPPVNDPKHLVWAQGRAHSFRHRQLQRVIEIRDEFVLAGHWRDERLDNFLRTDASVQRALERAGIPRTDWISPMQIQEVAASLRALADRIPNADRLEE